MILSKLHISVMLLGPLLAGAGTAGVAWATLGGKVTAVEVTQAQMEPRLKVVEGVEQEHKTGIAVLSTKLDDVLESLKRLEAK